MSRRDALRGLGAAALGVAAVVVAGCGPEVKSVDQVIGEDPLGPLYTEALTLMSACDSAIAAAPALAAPLGRLRDEHRQHALALSALMGAVAPTISPAPNAAGASIPPSDAATAKPPSDDGPSDPPDHAAIANLSEQEKAGQANASSAAQTAPSSRIATLAAIAACRATHVAALEVLR